MLIRFKITADNGVSIIDNGKAYIFNNVGMFVKEEDLSPRRLDGIQNSPIISIVSSANNTDIMVHNVDDMDKFYTSKDSAMECASRLTMGGDFLRMLRRNGKSDNIAYNQILFIYRADVNLTSKLSLLKLEERN